MDSKDECEVEMANGFEAFGSTDNTRANRKVFAPILSDNNRYIAKSKYRKCCKDL
jgi:hypothetical protein